ncbi:MULTISPECIES: TRAP transporter substrate-binding protein DctP [unclassified Halomonas]|uniref:TRAP transporter substrate-binding protein DctP n=1 Tax=unclassified Halomonas TaxID=2609666 RepID=UPI003F90D2C1
MKKTNLIKTIISTVLLSLSATANAQDTWTMTSTWPESLGLIEIDRHWVETVNKLTDGELSIEFRAGGTLMPSTEVFDATETGSIEASGDWPGYWAGTDSAFSPLGTTTMLFNGVDYLNWIMQWGGWELYQEVYGEYNIVYLPYGIVGSESGLMGGVPITSLNDIDGKRVRLAGRDQGRVLSGLGGSQVSLSGAEIYQAVERGIVDAMEFNTPGVDYDAGFAEVVEHWTVPGWHQTGSVLGVMINKDAWDNLSEQTQDKLKIAAESTMAWSLSWLERKSTEGAESFLEAGVEIHRLSEEDLETIQEITNQVIIQSACENPMTAQVYHSMVSYLEHYSIWRDLTVPFNMSRTTDNLPSLEELEACINQ